MDMDDLDKRDVVDAIRSAASIYKTLRSTSAGRAHPKERLYVIIGTSRSGLPIYTKGKLVSEGHNVAYLLVSAKRAE
jgi:hypothetical protein